MIEVPTRRGRARLEVAPQYTSLSIDDRLQCTITDEFVSLTLAGRRKPKRTSHRLDGAKLAVALAFPGHEVGLWMEQDGIAHRLCGVEPPQLLTDGAFRAWREVDRLAERLCAVLAARGIGGRLATEYGKGQHRVLLADRGDRLDVFARPLFRERPRKVFEIAADGEVVAGRRRPQRTRCSPRFDVAVTGDRLRLLGHDGADVARLYLPWIAPEDRLEIARRFDDLLRQAG